MIRYAVRMNSHDLSVLVRASEAARLLGIHPRTLAKWSDSGDAPAPVRVGPARRRFYRAEDIDALMHEAAA